MSSSHALVDPNLVRDESNAADLRQLADLLFDSHLAQQIFHLAIGLGVIRCGRGWRGVRGQ